jgi:arginine:ornithine antiporter / lysine permease
MILIPYLFSAVFGLTVAWRNKQAKIKPVVKPNRGDLTIAGIASVYCVWLLYAAGLKYLMLSALLYIPGTFLYIWAKKQGAERTFTKAELIILIALICMAGIAIYMLINHKLSF